MKKIFVIILAVSAFLASCSSPYYPEYVRVVSLGGRPSVITCEADEGISQLEVLSNVEYEATIISGSEWLSFTDTKELTRIGHGNGVIDLKRTENNNEKRLAKIVLSADTRHDTIKIKQKGRFEDFLTVHPDDSGIFSLTSTRMPMDWEGGDVSFRLNTSCMAHQLSAWTSDKNAVSGFKFENGAACVIFSFRVGTNEEQQPRIITVRISYTDGWGDVKTFEFTIKQAYNHDLIEE